MLQDKELTAICKVVIRDREALAALDPFEDTMLLTTLHWPDEIRSTGELDLPAEEFDFKPAERKMAEQLVEAMTDCFDPSSYKDEYREALLQVIDAKVDGQEIAAPEPVEESTNLVDLMKLLEASVKAATDQKTAGSPEPVSVADAKKERASRPAKAKAAAKPATEATARKRPQGRQGRRGRGRGGPPGTPPQDRLIPGTAPAGAIEVARSRGTAAMIGGEPADENPEPSTPPEVPMSDWLLDAPEHYDDAPANPRGWLFVIARLRADDPGGRHRPQRRRLTRPAQGARLRHRDRRAPRSSCPGRPRSSSSTSARAWRSRSSR